MYIHICNKIEFQKILSSRNLTPWDQPKLLRLLKCPDFPGQLTLKDYFGTSTKSVDYVGVLIFKCPYQQAPLYIPTYGMCICMPVKSV